MTINIVDLFADVIVVAFDNTAYANLVSMDFDHGEQKPLVYIVLKRTNSFHNNWEFEFKNT